MENKQDLESLISERIQKDKNEFEENYKNNCEKCKRLPEGKFCSKRCYYGSVFNRKGFFYKNAPDLAAEYFNINDKQKDEFVSFIRRCMDLYY